MSGKAKHVFISYSRENYDLVQRFLEDLQRANITIFLDKMALKPGTPDWEQALRDAIDEAEAVLLIASPESRKSTYVRDELAIALAKGKAIYPVWIAGKEWVDCIPIGLGHVQFVDMRGDTYATGFQQLVDTLHGEPVTFSAAARTEAITKPLPSKLGASPRNPYKGLQPFRAEDRADFFGRKALVNELVDILRNTNSSPRFLAVIGPSGSGKSSVVMAGLLPALQDGALDGSDSWIYLEPMTPGARPIEALTVALARVLPNRALPAIRDTLTDPIARGLHLLGRELITLPSKKRIVLYVDQFEELFTLTENENERRQFIDLLTTATCEANGAVLVIVTIRADFYDRLLNYPELGNLVKLSSQPILPLTLADLYEAVQGPAALPDVRLEFEEGLVTELIFAVRGEPGGLPLLQFTLDLLFQRREDRCLTHTAYTAIGGVRGALRTHAEATYDALPDDEHRQMTRALFLRLIEPGATEHDSARRRAALTELDLPDIQRSRMIHKVANAFTAARLLVCDKRDENDTHSRVTIEVVHEALILEWERLRDWLQNARDDVCLQRTISVDASEWMRRGNQPDDDMLYRGTVLDNAWAWAKRNAASVNEVAFIEAAVASETARKAADARIARQVQTFRRASATLAIVFLLAVVATVIALFSAQGAQDQRAEAETQAAGAQSLKATAVWDATYFAIEQGRGATLVAGVGIMPRYDPTLDPDAVIATATQIAALHAWIPVLELDEYGVQRVLVPAGCFWMGSVNGDSDERPVSEMCIAESFWIDKTEVTRAMYMECVMDGECNEPLSNRYSSNAIQPVNYVSWLDARAYCVWRGARLPTEVEWEYAARGPDSLVYPWGNEFLAEYVVYDANSDETAPVGSRPEGVSWVGALDMSGNVWEWTSSTYRGYPPVFDYVHEDDSDLSMSRVLRGGSFFSGTYDLRSTNRLQLDTEVVNDTNGFRCARSAAK